MYIYRLILYYGRIHQRCRHFYFFIFSMVSEALDLILFAMCLDISSVKKKNMLDTKTSAERFFLARNENMHVFWLYFYRFIRRNLCVWIFIRRNFYFWIVCSKMYSVHVYIKHSNPKLFFIRAVSCVLIICKKIKYLLTDFFFAGACAIATNWRFFTKNRQKWCKNCWSLKKVKKWKNLIKKKI